jgi:hypothetical protein
LGNYEYVTHANENPDLAGNGEEFDLGVTTLDTIRENPSDSFVCANHMGGIRPGRTGVVELYQNV